MLVSGGRGIRTHEGGVTALTVFKTRNATRLTWEAAPASRAMGTHWDERSLGGGLKHGGGARPGSRRPHPPMFQPLRGSETGRLCGRSLIPFAFALVTASAGQARQHDLILSHWFPLVRRCGETVRQVRHRDGVLPVVPQHPDARRLRDDGPAPRGRRSVHEARRRHGPGATHLSVAHEQHLIASLNDSVEEHGQSSGVRNNRRDWTQAMARGNPSLPQD